MDHVGHHIGVQVEHHPKRTGQRNHHNNDGEDQGQHIPAAFSAWAHVQEVHNVHNHLNGTQTQNDQCCQTRVFDYVAHDQPEWNDSQDNGQNKAGHVATECNFSVAAIVVMVIVCVVVSVVCAHGRTPIR